MKTSTLLIKSTALAAALILAAAANAQGYSGDQGGSGSSGSSAGGEYGSSGRSADYGPSELYQKGKYEHYGETMGRPYTASCESSASDRRNMYDHCGYNGTGPRIKGRY